MFVLIRFIGLVLVIYSGSTLLRYRRILLRLDPNIMLVAPPDNEVGRLLRGYRQWYDKRLQNKPSLSVRLALAVISPRSKYFIAYNVIPLSLIIFITGVVFLLAGSHLGHRS